MERIKYIPGDWVYIPKFGNYYTIISCGTYPYEARDENDNDVVIEEANIVPIPLTPEILDHNKWKRLKSKRYTWWRIRLDNVYYFIMIKNLSGISFYSYEISYIISLVIGVFSVTHL